MQALEHKAKSHTYTLHLQKQQNRGIQKQSTSVTNTGKRRPFESRGPLFRLEKVTVAFRVARVWVFASVYCLPAEELFLRFPAGERRKTRDCVLQKTVTCFSFTNGRWAEVIRNASGVRKTIKDEKLKLENQGRCNGHFSFLLTLPFTSDLSVL